MVPCNAAIGTAVCEELRVLNSAKTPPFYIQDDIDVDENIRLMFATKTSKEKPVKSTENGNVGSSGGTGTTSGGGTNVPPKKKKQEVKRPDKAKKIIWIIVIILAILLVMAYDVLWSLILVELLN